MPGTRTLHILHTNDVHSRFAQMPRIATCLKLHRSRWEAQGDLVLTVDVGDHADRMDIKTEATWGHANVDVLNESGYQYVTIGNNEGLTFPKAQLDALYNHAAFTVVLGNLAERDTGERPRWAVPYAVHEENGFRAALLGVTAPFPQFYRQLGWDVKDPLPLLREQVQALRPQVDAIIVLSHLGYAADVRMAREVPGIDLILGGHTHHVLDEGVRVGSTLIAQAGKFGEYVGHVRLVLDSERRAVVESRAEVLSVAAYAEDPDIRALLEREDGAAERVLSRPVARLSRDLPVQWEAEAPLGSFLAASLRRWTGADVGLANNGLLLAPLAAGEITRKDLLACLPHPINPCVVTLTGAQLKAVLERAVQPEIVARELKGFGFRGKVIGWMGIDGLAVRYVTDPEPAVAEVFVHGEPLDEQREYRVATVDMFMFTGLFPELLEARNVQYFLPEMLREVLAETLGDDALVAASFHSRWQMA